MGEAAQLYEEDFLAWTQEQAKALRAAARARAGSNTPLDYEHLAEEVEALGVSDWRELRRRIQTLIEHLHKLKHSPATEPRAGWRATVLRNRQEMEDLLARSPSLRRDLPEAIAVAHARAAPIVAAELEAPGELTPERRARLAREFYTEAEILGDWFPPPPAA